MVGFKVITSRKNRMRGINMNSNRAVCLKFRVYQRKIKKKRLSLDPNGREETIKTHWSPESFKEREKKTDV